MAKATTKKPTKAEQEAAAAAQERLAQQALVPLATIQSIVNTLGDVVLKLGAVASQLQNNAIALKKEDGEKVD